MKTFKLYSISLLKGPVGEVQQIPISIKDGLIINMENPEKTWYIDAVFEREHLPFFHEVKMEEKHMLAEVIITSKDNPPAAMITKIDTITELSEHISVLFEANMASRRDDAIHDILKSLLDEGYQDSELLERFHCRLKNDPTHGKQSLNNLYKSLKKTGQYHLV